MSIVWKFGDLATEKIEIYEDPSGQYHCRLETADGKTIAMSRGYHSKALCMTMIQKATRKAVSEIGQSTGLNA